MSRRLLLGLRIAVSAGLVGWLFTRIDPAEVATAIGAVGLGNLVLILALQLVNTALKSYKWQQLLEADGIHLPHTTAFASYMVGTFFSVFLPTAVGGDVVRALDTARRTGRRTATLASVAADRVLGFVAIGVLGLTATSGFGSGLEPAQRLGGIAIYLTVLGAALLCFSRRLLRVAGQARLGRFARAERVVRAAAQSLTAYRDSGRLLRLALLSIAAQAIVIVVVWMLARALEIAAPLSWFFVIVPLVGVVESIPVSVYGIGPRDVSYVYLLGLVGTEEARALSLSVLYVAVSVLYALLGGLVFAFRREARP